MDVNYGLHSFKRSIAYNDSVYVASCGAFVVTLPLTRLKFTEREATRKSSRKLTLAALQNYALNQTAFTVICASSALQHPP